MKVTNKGFNLSNKFLFRWLFNSGFYRLIWMAVKARNGYISEDFCLGFLLIVGKLENKTKRTIRLKGAHPLQVGWVLGQPVYSLARKKETKKKRK